MNPLSAMFGAGVALRNTLYDRHWLRVRKLARPVVSVGNISVGGSGKTPFVIALGELLQARDITFDVLSRGYGRRSKEISVVDPAGKAEQFGDEPLLIARKLQVPVIVGADRYQAGLLAEKNFNSKLHLLDDAFQHRRLHHDFDIVLLAASDFHDTLLPVGRLREPVSALRRADAAVSDLGESESLEAAALWRTARRSENWEAIRKVRSVEQTQSSPLTVLPTEMWRIRRSVYLEVAPKRAVAFCGIARPHQFFGQLAELGLDLGDVVAFHDHYRYSQRDINRLLRKKNETGADAFVTTEKDAINLGKLAEQLQPLHFAELRIFLEDPQRIRETLLDTLERRCGCRF